MSHLSVWCIPFFLHACCTHPLQSMVRDGEKVSPSALPRDGESESAYARFPTNFSPFLPMSLFSHAHPYHSIFSISLFLFLAIYSYSTRAREVSLHPTRTKTYTLLTRQTCSICSFLHTCSAHSFLSFPPSDIHAT